MSKFFRVLADPKTTARWYLKAPLDFHGNEIDARLFTMARVYDHALPVNIPLRRIGVVMDITFADFDMLVVSTKVVDEISKVFDLNIQRIPVPVDDDVGWEIVNPLTSISCVDEVRSEYVKWTVEDGRPEKVGQFRMFTKLKIRSDLALDSHLFRVAEWPVALLASVELKERLEELNVSGIVFSSV